MLTVAVTQEHISKGKRLWPRACALALALADTLGQEIAVGDVYYRYPATDNEEKQLPDMAIDFRRAFDREEVVKPFTFEMVDPRE